MYAPPWTKAELEQMIEHYPRGGSGAVLASGVDRTRGAIRRKAQDLGLTVGLLDSGKARKFVADRWGGPDVDDEILTMLRDYRGMPLTPEDFMDELALSQHAVRLAVDRLVDAGKLRWGDARGVSEPLWLVESVETPHPAGVAA